MFSSSLQYCTFENIYMELHFDALLVSFNVHFWRFFNVSNSIYEAKISYEGHAIQVVCDIVIFRAWYNIIRKLIRLLNSRFAQNDLNIAQKSTLICIFDSDLRGN